MRRLEDQIGPVTFVLGCASKQRPTDRRPTDCDAADSAITTNWDYLTSEKAANNRCAAEHTDCNGAVDQSPARIGLLIAAARPITKQSALPFWHCPAVVVRAGRYGPSRWPIMEYFIVKLAILITTTSGRQKAVRVIAWTSFESRMALLDVSGLSCILALSYFHDSRDRNLLKT